MKARDIMTGKLISIGQKEPISSAARIMKDHNLGALPVCDDDGRLRGLVTDRDIVTRCVAAEMDPEDTSVREIMTRGIYTCSAEDDVDQIALSMRQEQIRRLPVLEDGRLVGIVSLCDLARDTRCTMEAAQALTDISANIQRR